MARTVPETLEDINFDALKMQTEESNSVFNAVTPLLVECRRNKIKDRAVVQYLPHFERMLKKLILSDFNPVMIFLNLYVL